jgi:DNA-binding MarR family transcriptional regulator
MRLERRFSRMHSAPLTICACARLRRASRAITQLYDDALVPSGLRTTQFAVLRTLAAHESMTIGALASAMLLDRTALSRNLEPLASRGLVAITSGTDQRTRQLSLTPAGREALNEAERRWARAQRDVARRIGKPRLDQLYALLGDIERLHPTFHASKGPK